MKTIWKYPLEITERQMIKMPNYAKLLTVQVQDNIPCLWAMVDPDRRLVEREFITYGTGHIVKFDGAALDYIATYQTAGKLVFHVFEAVAGCPI